MNQVVHFEIPADDVERAQAFYRTAFNWNISQFGNMDYWMVVTTESSEQGRPKAPGAINGGLMKRDASAPSPIIVINTEDINALIPKVEAAGGTMIMPVMQMGQGLYARVKDPEGNVIGLWQDLQQGHVSLA